MRTVGRLALAALAAVALGVRPPGGPGEARAGAPPDAARTRVLAWGDQGDGTFRNPVLKADGPELAPQWQWNHNRVAGAWSLAARPGWLRLEARPASDMSRARDTLTQKLWDDAGVFEVRLDVASMANGQRAGLTFVSGSTFGWVGAGMAGGTRRVLWEGGEGPVLAGPDLWLRGRYAGDSARLEYSLDGRAYVDTGIVFPLRFAHWKGARVGIFCYGRDGHVDVDYARCAYSSRPGGDDPAR
jgi:hypothetical protein